MLTWLGRKRGCRMKFEISGGEKGGNGVVGVLNVNISVPTVVEAW